MVLVLTDKLGEPGMLNTLGCSPKGRDAQPVISLAGWDQIGLAAW